MAGRRNGRMTGMAGMAERQKEWQNGRMAGMATYVLFTVDTHTPRTMTTTTTTHYNLL